MKLNCIDEEKAEAKMQRERSEICQGEDECEEKTTKKIGELNYMRGEV